MADILDEFQKALIEHDDQIVLDRYYYSRPPAVLDQHVVAELRRAVARRQGTAMRDVIIAGSAQLGFTLVDKPAKGDRPARPMFSPFGDTSDIDVAVISTEKYVKLWRAASEYHLANGEWESMGSFRRNLMRGWLRPDYLPKDPEFAPSREWFEFFEELTASGRYGPYKITGGIYYDESFWESYAASSFNDCRLRLENPL